MLEARLEWVGWEAAGRLSFAYRKPSKIVFSTFVKLGHKSLSFSLSLSLSSLSLLLTLSFIELVIWNGKEVVDVNAFNDF